MLTEVRQAVRCFRKKSIKDGGLCRKSVCKGSENITLLSSSDSGASPPIIFPFEVFPFDLIVTDESISSSLSDSGASPNTTYDLEVIFREFKLLHY